jgi:hypothetical protein
MIPGGALAEREVVDKGLGFRARVIRRYFSHFLSLPQVLSYALLSFRVPLPLTCFAITSIGSRG